MLRRLPAATLAAALVSSGIVLAAGGASAAQCPTSSPQYPAQTCGISTNKSTVKAGAAVVVQGEGFSRSCGVTIAIDGGAVGAGKTNPQGKFTQQVTVPSSTSAGTHNLTAADQCSTFVLGEHFTVVAATNSNSGLPFTGFIFWPLLGGGAASVLAGTALVMAGRRRRTMGTLAA